MQSFHTNFAEGPGDSEPSLCVWRSHGHHRDFNPVPVS